MFFFQVEIILMHKTLKTKFEYLGKYSYWALLHFKVLTVP